MEWNSKNLKIAMLQPSSLSKRAGLSILPLMLYTFCDTMLPISRVLSSLKMEVRPQFDNMMLSCYAKEKFSLVISLNELRLS